METDNPEVKNISRYSIFSLVWGILSLILSLIFLGLPFFYVILGIIGVVVALKGLRKEPTKRKVAIAGLVINILVILLASAIFILFVIVWRHPGGFGY